MRLQTCNLPVARAAAASLSGIDAGGHRRLRPNTTKRASQREVGAQCSRSFNASTTTIPPDDVTSFNRNSDLSGVQNTLITRVFLNYHFIRHHGITIGEGERAPCSVSVLINSMLALLAEQILDGEKRRSSQMFLLNRRLNDVDSRIRGLNR